MELRQKVTVGEGGRVEITLPEAKPGEVIDLTVLFTRGATVFPYAVQEPRRAGSARGKVRIGPEFDDPVPGMEEYR